MGADFLRLPLPLLALGLIATGLWWAGRRTTLHPELARKGMHVGTGLVCLTLPLLFTTPWPVLTLALVSLASLVVLRHLPADGGGIASVLHGVARRSAGELYFPLAVVTLFLLNQEQPLYYVIPILVLTLADASAALVGLRYGLSRYRAEEGHKSAEGSLAFFLVAFLASHVPLLLFADIGRLESLLLAAVIGLLVMMLEAMAWRGLDNLFIPLGTWALLMNYRSASAAALVEVLVVTAALITLVLFWRRRTTLTDSSLMAAVLVGYTAWAVGGWLWLLPPALMFLSYTGLARFGAGRVVHDVRAVGAAVAGALPWLAAHLISNQADFLLPWTLAFAVQLAISSVARLSGGGERHPAVVLGTATAQGWLVVILPLAILGGYSSPAYWPHLAAGAALTAAAAIAFRLWQPGLEQPRHDAARWWRQGLIGAFVPALAGAALLWLAGA